MSLFLSHSKLFIFACLALNFLKTTLRTTLHSPVPKKLLNDQTGDPNEF